MVEVPDKQRLKQVLQDTRQQATLSDPPVFCREVLESDWKWLIKQAEIKQRYEESLQKIAGLSLASKDAIATCSLLDGKEIAKQSLENKGGV